MRKLCTAIVLVASLALATAAECAPDFTTCQPPGASATALPPAGTQLAPLYGHLLSSIKGIHARRVDFVVELASRDAPSICCADGTACLTLQTFNIPFCYDRFTTNFVLADGTSGTLDNGSLDIKDGPHVNMMNGTYSGQGGSGNIYGSSPPDTKTLPIPTPYTSAGVGSAIPITQLAGLVTITQTIPGKTIDPTTLAGTTSDVTLTLSSGTSVVGATTSTVGATTAVISDHTTIIGGSASVAGGDTIVATQPTTVTLEITHAPTTLPGTTVPPRTVTLTTSLSSKTTGAAHKPMPGVGSEFVPVLLAMIAVL